MYYGTEVAMDGGYDPDCRRCMPWEEIESGLKDNAINEIKSLISMRKRLQSCKSRNFHFPNDVADKRDISYIKIGDNESLQVYLNCEEHDVTLNVENFNEVVYSRSWEQSEDNMNSGFLKPNGILILTRN
jgi:glycosidase